MLLPILLKLYINGLNISYNYKYLYEIFLAFLFIKYIISDFLWYTLDDIHFINNRNFELNVYLYTFL